ncbi:NRAMP family Mn2+/Fe2+ transporter [Halobacteriales archaeon QS_8_65_32]|jgi:Mn2+/Fe2+ NRAMP family transporter|nr:MAG: NRAMP family Mn2+/Fe2+ transporter [Halobacteriales archaeon QS_8_65_32]
MTTDPDDGTSADSDAGSGVSADGGTAPDGGTGTSAGTADLTYPATDLRGFFREHFGPSMLWALIGIGGSHVLLGPIVASAFGLFAVWMYLFIFAVRYGGWELAVRYTYATGRSPIEGYRSLPGPKNWALWLALANFTIIAAVVVASVGVTSAAFAAVVVPTSSVVLHVALVGLAAVFVGVSRYGLLERVLTGFTVAVFLLIGLGVLVGPPSPEVIGTTLLSVPELPVGLYVVLFVAAAGVTPAGFSNSVFLGSWTVAKQQGARELTERGLDPENEATHEYIRAWVRTGKRDFNLGYAFSFLLLLAVVLLAANVLYPTMPTDENFAVMIGSILGETLGPWAFYAMVVGGFAAVFSTVIALLDGASRASSEVLSVVLDREFDDDGERRVRRALVAAIALGGIVPVLAFGALPVTFALVITLTVAVVEVFYYPANWYIVERDLPDPLRPSAGWRAYYAVSILLVVLFGLAAAASELGLLGGG